MCARVYGIKKTMSLFALSLITFVLLHGDAIEVLQSCENLHNFLKFRYFQFKFVCKIFVIDCVIRFHKKIIHEN